MGQGTQERTRCELNRRRGVKSGQLCSCLSLGDGLRREDRRRLSSNPESMAIVIAAAATVVTMRIAVSSNVGNPTIDGAIGRSGERLERFLRNATG